MSRSQNVKKVGLLGQAGKTSTQLFSRVIARMLTSTRIATGIPFKPCKGRRAILVASGKSVKTDYGQDWYKSRQQAEKDTTIREDLIRAQRANQEAKDRRDRKDLYTDNWDGDQYKGSRINVLTLIVFLFIAVPVLGLIFAWQTYGTLWG